MTFLRLYPSSLLVSKERRPPIHQPNAHRDHVIQNRQRPPGQLGSVLRGMCLWTGDHLVIGITGTASSSECLLRLAMKPLQFETNGRQMMGATKWQRSYIPFHITADVIERYITCDETCTRYTPTNREMETMSRAAFHSIVLTRRSVSYCINAPLGFLNDSAIPRKVCESWTCGHRWIEHKVNLESVKQPTLSIAS